MLRVGPQGRGAPTCPAQDERPTCRPPRLRGGSPTGLRRGVGGPCRVGVSPRKTGVGVGRVLNPTLQSKDEVSTVTGPSEVHWGSYLKGLPYRPR